uniref:Cysteine rich secreted protein n=1 Tax=Riptortus pedestris TaxID=329032 RepID=R4WP53_RIPPE|nr:cysteine rich secreted protein [Riptortus pedestris]
MKKLIVGLLLAVLICQITANIQLKDGNSHCGGTKYCGPGFSCCAERYCCKNPRWCCWSWYDPPTCCKHPWQLPSSRIYRALP